ncbi:IQ and ubiquitin-like domain-containing protein [Colletes gigas]|uniref:IQ and ubiquitin-like domain-containing protein n=1 Tax=Colletes gigas TaxID=935657 RepID=UPI001C9A7CB4|nr:IQ and ubiquitin-like domain-containing protein [Colletes gigas]
MVWSGYLNPSIAVVEAIDKHSAQEERAMIARTEPFLGGWRNRLTGTVYCNACTQTRINRQDVSERTTQTEFSTDKCTDTPCNVTVQANSFPDKRDRLLEATSFKDPRNEKILESVVKIQRFYRAHRYRFTAIRPLGDKDTAKQEIPLEPMSYRSQDFAILNRTSPRTRTDFELLYNLLDRWRIRETERARQRHSDPARTAFCRLILSKEIELLRGIDSLKTGLQLKSKNKVYRKFLDDLSKPIVWRTGHGEPILVETPRVQRARRFRDAFEALSNEDGPIGERVGTLRRLRNVVEAHTCKPSDDLVRLLDQEIDLLGRDVDESKLNWLRNRLKIAFLIFAREALGNDSEGARLIGRKTICASCGRLLSADNFSWVKRRRAASCNYCQDARTRSGPRVVYGPYDKMLRDLRRSEAGNRCYASLAFVVDAKIVHRLVNDVWHGKSAISQRDRLDELRLVRLRRNVQWSPWNCLLLTANEASVHTRIDDLDEFYGPMMLHKFHTRNLQAKLLFESVAGIQKMYPCS